MRKIFLGGVLLAVMGLAAPLAFNASTPAGRGPNPAPLCGRCGDGYCAKQCGETLLSCPADCGGSSY